MARKSSLNTPKPPPDDESFDVVGVGALTGLGAGPDWLGDPPLGFEAGLDAEDFDGSNGFLLETTGLSGCLRADGAEADEGFDGAGCGLRAGGLLGGGGRFEGHQPPHACLLNKIIPASTTNIITAVRFIGLKYRLALNRNQHVFNFFYAYLSSRHDFRLTPYCDLFPGPSCPA